MEHKKVRILIFGGSFDPPHKMHIKILTDAASVVKPDRIIIVPSWRSPFKSGHWAFYKQREILVRKALLNFRFNDITCISSFEAKRKIKTYTWQLISWLKKEYPHSELFFLIGSDLLSSFKKWKKPDYIQANCKIIVAPRGNLNACKDKRFIFLKKIYPDFSSSSIRKKILLGDFSMLSPAVKNEILSNNMYFSKTAMKVSTMMSKERFSHTISVCLLASAMAERYGVNTKKAILAALLHDCAKEWPLERQIKKAYLLFRHRDFQAIAKKAPGIIHQYASAAEAFFNFSVKDKEILLAISSHSCGKKNPSKLSKILEIADFSSPDRKYALSAKIRKMAFSSLEKSFVAMRKFKKRYLEKQGLEILPYE